MIRLTRTKTVAVPFLAVASLLLFPAAPAQNSNARKDQAPPAATSQAPAQAKPEVDAADRSKSYFHDGMAAIYEDEAVASGRPEFVAHSIEEYKAALNADPTSPSLNNALADLYLRVGRVKEAESTARTLLKSSPDDLDAHKLLGRIFLRQLSEAQNAVSSSSPSGNVLDEAIAEFQKILSLQPKDVEDHMILGQLYAVRHESAKAEEQYKLARTIEPDSEDAILNLARLYAENNDVAKAAKVIEDVPQQDRTAKMESALGTAYDQLKQPKEAIAAYQRALDLDPADVRSINALAQALLNDNQLDAALKQYKNLSEADPDDIGSLIHISEIQRRQGKYEDALTTIRTAVKKDPDSLEAGYNEGLLLDVLGRFDEAVQVYQHMVDLTSHANGAYTSEEKNNRGIFLDRLGALYHEENKTDQAIETYQKLIDLGGDQALRGYQGEVDTYRDAKMFDKAIEVARKAAATDPKNTDLKLMLAGEMADSNNPDDGITMAKSLLTNTDKDRVVWLSLAQTYTRLRRWKDADDALNKAASLTTKQDDKIYLLFLRGALAERQKHYDTAEQFFHQVLDIDPNNAMTLNYMGYMFADKGTRLPEAIKLIRKAVELDPMNGAYLDSLGWAYFKMGQYELAEENLRQAVDRDQTDPTVHDHLGDLYEKTGRIRLAAAQWELSLAEFAKSAPADLEPTEVAKVQHKLETARVKLAKEDSLT
ncbi:MAG: tetratricopeptide repeat protein, partial [Acidobacteriota bacterium]|nr:tetratricopeptide repeat protein [Acidobacteriota bacterium]